MAAHEWNEAFYFSILIIKFNPQCWGPCDEAPGICAKLLIFASVVLVAVTIPFSLCLVIKVVQEYEKTVIFRLGRILSGGARGPGVFFIIPCVDLYEAGLSRKYSYSSSLRGSGGGMISWQKMSGNLSDNFWRNRLHFRLFYKCLKCQHFSGSSAFGETLKIPQGKRFEDTSDLVWGHWHENTELLSTTTRGDRIFIYKNH